ncbi:MAG: glutamate-cysteine ligase family protein, partial [Pseudomonadota bacterium]|nr:glutamate-cysteine ligase family protein [Pseudomonadota bacterium]
MARDTADATPIENRDELAAHLGSGAKPRDAWRIGTEHEKFGFYKDGHSPVPYDGPAGIRALLEGMQSLLGWEPIRDGEAIIGLADPIGGGAISLEPGGQFELSGAPLKSIHQTCREVNGHLAQVRQVADPLGIGFLGLGMSPRWKLRETPVMPKSRYKIMADYMSKVGTRGLDMMFRTCTVQVNLDFSSEADMRDKLRVGLALQP